MAAGTRLRDPVPRVRVALITLVGLAAALSWLYPLADGLRLSRFLWAQQAGASIPVFASHLGVYGVGFAAYAVVVRHAGLIRERWLWGTFALSVVALLFGFPGDSSDVFDYLVRGRMLFEYGISPLVYPPSRLSNAPFVSYVTWFQWVDAYGPIWEYASAGLAALARLTATAAELTVTRDITCDKSADVCAYLTRYVTLYRLFASLMLLGCVWLARGLVQPDRRNTAVALVLFNPLTWVAAPVGAHNDTLMLLLVLAGISLLYRPGRARAVFGVVALLLAAHVKLTALILLPPVLIWLWRRDGFWAAVRVGLLAFVLALPVSYALYAPLGGWGTLEKNLFERLQLSANSVAELLYRALRFGLGVPRYTAQFPIARVSTALFALITLVGLFAWLRRKPEPTLAALAGLCVSVSLAYLAVGSFWFQPWYVLWPVVLLALAPEHTRLRRVVIALSVGALTGALIGDYARHVPWRFWSDWHITAGVVLLTFGPALLVARACLDVSKFRFRAGPALPADSPGRPKA
jgi:hypothetical protein